MESTVNNAESIPDKIGIEEDGPAFTIPQFCSHYQFSRPFYYELKKKGKGPVEIRIGRAVRILHKWRKAWEAARTEA